MRTLGLASLVLIAACGFPRPADVKGDGGTTDGTGSDGPPASCTGCELTAVRPSIANAGATLTLEGTFTDPIDVAFPGGTHVAGTLLGPHRATVVVPPGATNGALTVSSGGVTQSLPFRRAAFGLGLSHFYPMYPQTDSARMTPTLQQARRGLCAAVIGGYVYALGGEDGNANALGTVERALINADGTLQPFSQVTTLATARKYAACAVIGTSLYVFGGRGTTSGLLATIEAAPINADGTLGTFADTGIALPGPLASPTAEVIGSYLYLIGGDGMNGASTALQRVPIHADGTLGAFEDGGTSLVLARSLHTSAVIGPNLYVFGGETNGTYTATVEKATIAPDGTIGGFATDTTAMLGVARTSHVGVVLGDHYVVIGGRASGIGADNIESAPIDASGTLGAFTNVDTWSNEHWLGAGVIIGNFLYVIGGQKYNPAEKTFERASIDGIGALGTPTISTSALAATTILGCNFVLGNHAYVLGGYTGSSDSDIVQSAPIDADGNVGNFTITGHLVTPRQQPTCAIVGNTLYVLGGFNQFASPRYLDTIETATINADGTLGTFSTVAGNHLVTPRGGHRAFIGQTVLYLLGGIGQVGGPGTGNEVIQNTAEAAGVASDGTLGTFQQLSLQTLSGNGRTRMGIALLGSWLYLIGGSDTTSDLATLDYIILTQSWMIGGTMSNAPTQLAVGRQDFSTLVLGNQILTVGGTSNIGTFRYLDTVETATLQNDGRIGAFPPNPTGGILSSVRYGHTSGITGNHAWHLGGANSATTVNTIDQSTLQ